MVIFILVLILIFPTLSFSATVFIDPTCGNNGDGTVGSPCAASGGGVGPKNTWVGLTWTAGNTYAGQGGTSETLTNFLVAGSGTAGNPITITSYGTGQFRFHSTASYAVAFGSRSFLTFDNVEFSSTITFCLYPNGAFTNLIVRNSTFRNCAGSGISFEGQSATADMDLVSITGNTFSGTIGANAIGIDIINTNANTFDQWSITNNIISASGTATNSGAISIIIDGGATAKMTNLSITGNTISSINLGDAGPASIIRVIRSGTPASHEDRFLGVNISSNTITDSNGNGVDLNNVGLLGGELQGNCLCRNTISNLTANAGLAIYWSELITAELNTISGIIPVNSNIDGAGFDIENNQPPASKPIYIRSNTITNCKGSSLENSGEGIYVVLSGGIEVYSNLLVGNRKGIFSDGGGGATANAFYNNTIVNSDLDGIHASWSVTKVNTFTNNIIYGSGRYGINDSGISDQTLTKNIFFNNASGNYNSITPGGTDILQDPLLLPTYKIQPASPARRAGVFWGGECVDLRGRRCNNPPDIGSYQMTSGDPAGSRSTR